MLSTSFVAVAVALRFAASLSYLLAAWKGTVRPNPVTWLLWGLTPFVAFAAQRQEGVGPQAWMTAAIGVGPLLIFLVALGRHTSWRIGVFDVLCGASAAVGVISWQAADDPALAVVFSIAADALGGVPTIVKGYRAPDSEKTFPYWLTIAAFSITLLTVDTWNFVNCAFFCYGVLVNLTVSTVVSVRSAQLRGAGRPRLVPVPRPRAAPDGPRIDVLEARVAELERMLAMEPADRRRPPDPAVVTAAAVARDRWEGWEGSA
jgi:hypothetical protein